MKQREYPENPDCPLTDQEKEELNRNLEDLEAEYYFPFKHRSGGFSDATVYAIDEYEVEVEYTDNITIERP